MSKTVLAIDPGPKESAYCLWDGERILEKGKVPNEELMGMLYEWGLESKPPRLFIEMVASYGMAVGAEVFETVFWLGRFYEMYLGHVYRVYRLAIKMHHCHQAKANDSNIRQALIDRLGEPGVKKNPGVTYGVSKDVWSALAIAVYAYDCYEELTK